MIKLNVVNKYPRKQNTELHYPKLNSYDEVNVQQNKTKTKIYSMKKKWPEIIISWVMDRNANKDLVRFLYLLNSVGCLAVGWRGNFVV